MTARHVADHWLALALTGGLAACGRPSLSPAPLPAPAVGAARACPAPDLPTGEWSRVTDSSGFVIALPPGFEERPEVGPLRHWQLGGDFQQWLMLGTIRGDVGSPDHRRPYQPDLMLDYSECVEVVAGHPVSIQAWRTPGGVFRNRVRLDRYDVFAIWEGRPGVLLYLTAGTYSRPTHDIFLAAVRAWRPAGQP
ncbi:MAG: hypothetical protein ACKVZ0_22285 [Gemmatimonadales bacterium]